MSTHSGILIHVVFSTKQRFKLLDKTWRDDLFGVMGGNAKTNKGAMLQAGGTEDQVQLLLKIHPSFAIADTIKLIQGNSSPLGQPKSKDLGKILLAARLRCFFRRESIRTSINSTLKIKSSIIKPILSR